MIQRRICFLNIYVTNVRIPSFVFCLGSWLLVLLSLFLNLPASRYLHSGFLVGSRDFHIAKKKVLCSLLCV